MEISTPLLRFTAYYSRHGFGATIQRTALAIRRSLFANRAVIFWCDLSQEATLPEGLPPSLKVERLRSLDALDQQELHEITQFWNPKLASRNIKERFDRGASLWVIRFEGELAGYGWTLQGSPISPYYFPLATTDVQFFDFHVFRKFRGRAIDWCLMTRILHELAAAGARRAFAEAAEWNCPSLSSIGMTPFRRLGCARTWTIFRRTIVCWSPNKQSGTIQ